MGAAAVSKSSQPKEGEPKAAVQQEVGKPPEEPPVEVRNLPKPVVQVPSQEKEEMKAD
jgi:hypothetical protein